MKPVVHGLEAQYGDRMSFVYLDIDDPANDAVKQQLGYRYQPNVFILDAQGKIRQRFLGFTTKEQLEAAIRQAIE